MLKMKMSPLVIFLITLGKYIWASPRVFIFITYCKFRNFRENLMFA